MKEEQDVLHDLMTGEEDCPCPPKQPSGQCQGPFKGNRRRWGGYWAGIGRESASISERGIFWDNWLPGGE